MTNSAVNENIVLRKKLIEVALPLDAINQASESEKKVKVGKPTNMHLWWARRPLATARAVIFAQMVDDPSGHVKQFPTLDAQNKERQRLFRLIEQLVLWENTTNETLLQAARDEIHRSWRLTCDENKNHQQADFLFNPEALPAFHDPFAGGGTLPLEAQRLGLESYATDLNPVAVLINKAMVEFPGKFSGFQPINPETAAGNTLIEKEWSGSNGIIEDIHYYANWIRDVAEKRIGNLYPKVNITLEMTEDRPDLERYLGEDLTVVARIWARTTKSPNPAFSEMDVPLVSTFMLSTKPGKEAYIEPIVEGNKYRFVVRIGKPPNLESTKKGTKLARGANFQCILSNSPIDENWVKAAGQAGTMGSCLLAVVAEGTRGRVYLSADEKQAELVIDNDLVWQPELTISGSTQYVGVKPYGMASFDQLFTNRQMVALTTFSDLLMEVRSKIVEDAQKSGRADDGIRLDANGDGVSAYADAVTVYLGLCQSRLADWNNSLCRWENVAQVPQQLFGRQALPMTWDYCEGNPLSSSTGSFNASVKNLSNSFFRLSNLQSKTGTGEQQNAMDQTVSLGKVVSTDPPYFDNVPYADLSDFFYVWLRRSFLSVFPDLFSTIATPKEEELVAFAHRHDGKAGAESFFLNGMTEAMRCIADQAHPSFPITIYYAFKQSEHSDEVGRVSTGWDTFLSAVLNSGLAISGTWPMRTESTSRLRSLSSNALASSIVLVCRRRELDAGVATRREFIDLLNSELPVALQNLQRGNIAPVDLAQAAIGPGMEIFSRYSRILEASGNTLSVRDALGLINQTLETVLTEQEGNFDLETRWALGWFDESGFSEGDYGRAEQLATSKNTSVAGMADAGILVSGRGKVHLLTPDELPEDWDPQSDRRFATWEAVHHLVRVLQDSGESAAGELQAQIGPSSAEKVRELAYRLYAICEHKGWSKEALSYNSLVQSWPEITRLAQTEQRAEQGTLI